ncbi:MAG: methyltransferase domain-containing protein, partial [Blastochloris sp.]|nr:methyltransferase domain-containing protein [Blastochloris sp.]
MSESFDSYRDNYERVVQESVAFSGLKHDFFLAAKIIQLRALFARHFGALKPSLLDIGCGDGNYTGPAAECTGSATGLDRSPEMLRAAERRLQGVAGLRWVEGDATRLPFDDGSFDAVLIVTPYYNKPTQGGLYAHYAALDAALHIPIVIYNIPGRSVIDMGVDTMARLAKLPNIVGVKDATADMHRASRQRLACGPDFIHLTGDDASTLGYMAHGGHGCISVISNIAPRACADF